MLLQNTSYSDKQCLRTKLVVPQDGIFIWTLCVIHLIYTMLHHKWRKIPAIKQVMRVMNPGSLWITPCLKSTLSIFSRKLACWFPRQVANKTKHGPKPSPQPLCESRQREIGGKFWSNCPRAFCRVPNCSTKIDAPGTNHCHSTWTFALDIPKT